MLVPVARDRVSNFHGGHNILTVWNPMSILNMGLVSSMSVARVEKPWGGGGSCSNIFIAYRHRSGRPMWHARSTLSIPWAIEPFQASLAGCSGPETSQEATQPYSPHAACPASTTEDGGLLFRNLNQVTIIQKPYYLLHIHVMVT